MLATRRLILEHILVDLKSGERIRFAGRHLEVNGFHVSLATGRVRRDGDLIDIPAKKRHGLWQPASDRLLTTIVGTVVALLELTPASGGETTTGSAQ
ncbi:hypothetical protein [Mycolicibacterium houstonense]|uniref:hypothetical protein n=1 Tax=Mycolicibacterium houstonense TaxID=146021 RepID=UPI003F948B7B